MSVTMIFRQNPGVTIAIISNFGKQLSSDNVDGERINIFCIINLYPTWRLTSPKNVSSIQITPEQHGDGFLISNWV